MSDSAVITEWDENKKSLITRFSGKPTITDVHQWRDELYNATQLLPDNTNFKMLIDLRGYTVDLVEKEIHFVQREVIPTFLSLHNFKVGYLALFEAEVAVKAGERNVNCVAVAHIHHECHKMEAYDQKFGRNNDRYFCDGEAAEQWLDEYKIETGSVLD